MELSLLEWIWLGQILLVSVPTIYYMARNQIMDGVKLDSKREQTFLTFSKRIYHFYVVALLWCGFLLWTTLRAYCQHVPPYQFLSDSILVLSHGNLTWTTDAMTTLVLLALFVCHMTRRLYECWSVSIFSYRATVSLLGLLLSHGFYICVGFTLVAESPSLQLDDAGVSLRDLKWYHLAGLGLFIFASMKHHTAHKILAKLRRNRAGHIVTTGYKMPKGDWFELVSCPHYLAEVLIYISLCACTGFQNRTLILCSVYVLINQLLLAHSTHAWYQKKFDDFPKQRKMLIPFVL